MSRCAHGIYVRAIHTYKLPRPNTANSLAFREEAKFRRHRGRMGRTRTNKSVIKFKPPETHGRILGFQQRPGKIGFQARWTGLYVNIVANSNPLFEHSTITIPRYIKCFTVLCAQKMRRNSTRNTNFLVHERTWKMYCANVKNCKLVSTSPRNAHFPGIPSTRWEPRVAVHPTCVFLCPIDNLQMIISHFIEG
jgi:hypothetical protein